MRPSGPGTTIELFDMFCALYGATRTPRRANARHSPVVTTLLPASDVVPATSSPLITPPSSAAAPGMARARCRHQLLLENRARDSTKIDESSQPRTVPRLSHHSMSSP